MSSLTLDGATGANLGWARDAKPGEVYDITFVPKRRFILRDVVPVDEQMLREWFGRFLNCGPSKVQIDDVDPIPIPTIERQRELDQLLPDIGFQLTGEVDRDAGFVVSWGGGWLRGNAGGFLLAVNCDIHDKRFHALRMEIESFLLNANDTCNNEG